MPEFSNLWLFIVASVALSLTPGPAVMYVVASSVHQGRVAGLISVLGLESGTLIQVIATSLGLSAVIASSAAAFTLVKLAGASYLIFIGIRTLLSKETLSEETLTPRVNLRQVYSQGLLVNALNPKTALFFIAFLPQFANPAHGSTTLQLTLLGVLFVLLAACTDSFYALLSGSAANWLKRSRRFAKGQRIFAATMYIVLGILAAFAGVDSQS